MSGLHLGGGALAPPPQSLSEHSASKNRMFPYSLQSPQESTRNKLGEHSPDLQTHRVLPPLSSDQFLN